MAEEFEGGVCGGNWAWNSPRNLFASSPCSLGSFGWPNHDVMVMETKTARSSDDSASDGGGSVVMPPNGFEMMEMGISPDWNQDLLNNSGRSEQNYSNFLVNSNMNYEHGISKVDESFSKINSSLVNTSCFPITDHRQTLSTGFPLNSASYNYTSSLLQTLFDTDDSQLPQQSLLDYSSSGTNYQDGFLANLPKPSPVLNQQPNNRFPNAPLWSATPADLSNLPSTNFTQSHHSSSLNNKRPNHPSFVAKHQGKESGSVAKKGSNEAAAFKRPRIETPSPLPTFKVRKEKLGDRITALQQLVSPFGKTDTASVLHEAIEYIKFLHDQVNALSTPYLKYGSTPLQRQQDGEGVIKDLNSRGLCLVPLSSTFPVATETPSDFWTPTFAGNLN